MNYLPPELNNIVNDYIGYRVEYTDGSVEWRTGQILNYDEKRKEELKIITGCFNYFIDKKMLFMSCPNLIEVPKNVCILIEDCTAMFYRTGTIGDISNWDVSNVINMKQMFAYSKINGDISNWNMSGVKNIGCFIILMVMKFLEFMVIVSVEP
jgi:hypothetical protein